MKEALLDCIDIIACPSCGDQPIFSERKISCSRCNKEWEIDEDGVLHFLGDVNYFFGTSKEREEINAFLFRIRNMDPQLFFQNLVKFEKEYKFFSILYCLDPVRADWSYFGDFSSKVVVDLGCGYGATALSLAERAKSVIAVDFTLERIKFLSIIAQFKNLKNIVPIHANVFNLPLKENSIDRFVMIGLLEWLGIFRDDKSPFEVHREFLKYLRKFLTENGEVWIGIENRLNPLYFVGKTHHGDLPFAPLMPRFISNFVYRLFGKEGYKTWTYTKYEYQKLLMESGFKNIEFLYTFPHYQIPKFISTSAEPNYLMNYLDKRGIFWGDFKATLAFDLLKLLIRLRLAGVLAPAFFIKAKKG